jgi:hypothetical protein
MKNLISQHLRFAGLLTLLPALAGVANAQIVAPDGLHLEADTGVTASGGVVSQWVDQVNSIAFTPPNNSPTLVASDFGTAAGIHFTLTGGLGGVNSELTAAGVTGSDISSANAGTIIIVERANTADGFGQNSVNWASANNNQIAAQDFGGSIAYVHGDSGNGGFISATAPGNWFGTSHVLTLVESGGVGSIRVDGSTIANNVSFSDTLTVNTTGNLSIGNVDFSGDIGAVLMYKTALNASQISQTEIALGTKYGISVVPEPSQYASAFAVACLAGAIVIRMRRQARA